jgi:hypothetical protein
VGWWDGGICVLHEVRMPGSHMVGATCSIFEATAAVGCQTW